MRETGSPLQWPEILDQASGTRNTAQMPSGVELFLRLSLQHPWGIVIVPCCSGGEVDTGREPNCFLRVGFYLSGKEAISSRELRIFHWSAMCHMATLRFMGVKRGVVCSLLSSVTARQRVICGYGGVSAESSAKTTVQSQCRMPISSGVRVSFTA